MGDQKGWFASSMAKGVEIMAKVKTESRPEFEKALCEIFEPDRLREIAKETEMIKRERKIDPVIIFWSLIFGFGVELKRSLASLKRKYEIRAKTNIGDRSWYDRFSPELVLFLKECVKLGIDQYGEKEHRNRSERSCCLHKNPEEFN